MPTRRKGEYVPLSIVYMDDDALLNCSPLAELLYVRMLAVAGQLKTDGYLTRAQIVHRAGARLGEAKVPKLLAELTAAGPVVESDGGYRIRAWLEWNSSAEELRRTKAKDAERKRAERAGQDPDGPRTPPPVPPESERTETDVRAESSRTRPGRPPDSGGTANGQRSDSVRSPASRAPDAQAGASRASRAGHGTVRNGTTDSEPSVPRAEADVIPINQPTAQTLVAEWLDERPQRPPGRVIGQVAKEVGQMLAERIPADAIRAGLRTWQARGQHPSTLPSFVAAAMEPAGTLGHGGNTYAEPPPDWIEQARRVVAAWNDDAGMPGPEVRAGAVRAAREMCAQARDRRWRIPEPLLAVARDGAA